MKIYTFETTQKVPHPIGEVFEFFSDPNNLERITPSILNFKIVKMSTPKIEQGTIIDYRLKIRGVPIKWKTEIQKWTPNVEFVDNQLKGPYKLWHHTHQFKSDGNETLIVDTVNYVLPFGPLGQLAAKLWVSRDVEKIFEYRKLVIAQTFPSK